MSFILVALLLAPIQGTLTTGGTHSGTRLPLIHVNASENWEFVRQSLVSSQPMGDVDFCLGGGNARALVQATSDQVLGDGVAVDAMPFCDVRAAVVSSASFYELWRYRGKGTGRADVAVRLAANGVADLKNADCAAAALGFATFESSVTALVDVVLDQSAGETETDALGNISLGYKVGGGQWGVSLPVTIGRGEGRYPDDDTGQANCPGPGHSDCCTNEFWREQQTEGHVTVWADGGWLGLDLAECEASMYICMGGTINLSDCP